MQLYNTLTKTVDEFKTYEPGVVKMYTCGPTVYHFAHIGNLRTYIMEDVLEKFLRFEGYRVDRAMNITDVGHLSSDADTGEDKMLKGAKRENKSVMDIAAFYTDAFFADCQKLNIRKPDTVIPATSRIEAFIEMVSTLLEKGYAYIAGGNVYFDVSKLDDYYVLAGKSGNELLVGVRDDVDEDENKRNKADFVLWFTKSKFDSQELKWDSPWGVGYPGWHIECSAIAMGALGERLDLHCGGVDNIFPHHTNEIAQSEAYVGHEWCSQWFHVQHLNDINGKMSKSRGDFLTVSLLENKGYDPLAYRYFCLQSHYRKPLDFSFPALDNATAAFKKLLSRVAALSEQGDVDASAVDAWKERFSQAVGNDLNTSLGITVLYDLLKADVNDATKREVVRLLDEVLSLDLLRAPETAEVDSDLAEFVERMIAERAEAKARKDYAEADRIRALLAEKGVTIKDTRDGVEWSVN